MVCALKATRGQLGARGVEPYLCRREVLARVDEMFADDRQHDAGEFAVRLLEVLAGAEEAAGRVGPWPGSQWGVASHVDRLFGYVEETRRVSGLCGAARKRFCTERVLILSLAEMSEDRS